jgi:hypothetical protein
VNAERLRERLDRVVADMTEMPLNRLNHIHETAPVRPEALDNTAYRLGAARVHGRHQIRKRRQLESPEDQTTMVPDFV